MIDFLKDVQSGKQIIEVEHLEDLINFITKLRIEKPMETKVSMSIFNFKEDIQKVIDEIFSLEPDVYKEEAKKILNKFFFIDKKGIIDDLIYIYYK